jgi:tRNA threonylcarbamoyladenosine biosynthesis protein TsaE
MKKFTFSSNSPAATSGFGKRIGEQLQGGSVIALIGELGCGKTLFTRGICEGLGVPLRQVNSPTFVLVNEYRGRLPVFHMDLYRLGETADGFEIGILDYLVRVASGVMVVEWAEKVLSLLPRDRLEVRFHILSVRKRRIELSAGGARFDGLLKELG